jgi:hypothetical protein
MQDLAKLSDLAACEIEKLRAEGIVLTPAEIVELNALGWAVETPETRRLLARGVPVEIGGVYLWPLSLYAQEWFARVGARLGDNIGQTYALAYAMAHGRDDGEPLAFEGRPAEKIIARWGKSLKCTFGELNVAIAQILQQEEEAEQPPEETGGMTAGDLSALLAAACGDTPDFWERRCASGYALAVLSAIILQNQAEKKSCMADPRIKAERALGWAIAKIEKSRIKVGAVSPKPPFLTEPGALGERALPEIEIP